MSIDELRRRHDRGQLLPFIGAGASMSVRWKEGEKECRGPSWAELVDRAAQDLGFESAELLRMRATDLAILEYYSIKKGGLGPLSQWLTTSMRPPDEALRNSPIHSALAKLRCSRFYTTNYDDFIERSFGLAGKKVATVALEQDNARTKAGECEVVKFHGDLRHPTTMVVSERDYHRRLSFSTSMDFRLLADLLNRVVLFVGFSFTDSNISYLFYKVQEMLGPLPDATTGHRAYIIVPDPSDFERKLFGRRNIEVLAYDGVDHTHGVADILEQLTK